MLSSAILISRKPMRLLVYVCHMYVALLKRPYIHVKLCGLHTSAHIQEILQWSPDPFPSQRGGVWGQDWSTTCTSVHERRSTEFGLSVRLSSQNKL